MMNRRRTVVLVAWLLTATSSSHAQHPTEPGAFTLDDAVRTALGYHPSVLAARAGEAEASALAGVQTAHWWPQLGVEGSLFRYQKQMLVFPIHELSQEAFQFDRTLLQGSLNLGWTLFEGGARTARISGARAQEGVASARREGSEMTLIADVTRAYLEVLSAHGTLQAQLQSLQALEAERERVERLLAEGRAARVELLRVDAAIAQAEAERVATATELDTAERRLARLLGVAPEGTRAARLSPVRLAATAPLPDRQLLLEQFGIGNPQLAEARSMTDAADADRKQAVADWWPRLDVAGSYLLFTSPTFDVQGEWLVGVRLSYPLFTGGARSRAVSTASARAQYAREQYRLARLRGEEAVDRTLGAVLEWRAQVEAVGTAVEHLAEVARIERLALQEGAGTQTDYLRAEAEWRRASASLVRARHAEIAAQVELASITGVLSPQWISDMLEITP
jgi:outer membrane protein TolC